MKYLHVLLDADMTLIDFKAAQRSALITTYEKYGFPVNEESIAFYDQLNDSLWKKLERKEITKPELIDCRFKIMCEHFGVEHPGDDSMEMFYQSELAKGHDLMPDAYEVCARLGRHFRLSLVTNGTAAVQHQRLQDCTLLPFFQNVFVSEDIGFNKPSHEFFQYVYEQLGCPDKSSMIIVGDSMTSDIKGGYDFGIDTCHIVPETPEYGEIVPTYTIHSLKELYDVLYEKPEIE